jgi:hypothetical protein
MPELESGTQHFSHTSECTACAALLEQQRTLAVGLQRLAEGSKAMSAPPRLEARLVAAYRAKKEPRPISKRRPTLLRLWSPAIAAAIALVFLVGWSLRPKATQIALPVTTQPAEVAEVVSSDSDFVALPHADVENLTDGDLVQVEMPRATLAALGVPLPDEGTTGKIRAEVVLGPGGVPQAVRLLE